LVFLNDRSDVSSGVGLVGLLVLVAWVLVCRSWASVAVALGIGGPMEPLAGPYAALVALLLSSGAMVLWSVAVDKVHRRATTGIDWASPRPWREVFGISAVKLVGLWATWAVIGAAYCLFRFYWQEPWIFAIHLIGVALVPMVLLSIPTSFGWTGCWSIRATGRGIAARGSWGDLRPIRVR
jgi:hypothetical protein